MQMQNMTNSIIVPFDIRNDMYIDKQNHKYKHDKKRIKRIHKKNKKKCKFRI